MINEIKIDFEIKTYLFGAIIVIRCGAITKISFLGKTIFSKVGSNFRFF